MPYMVMRTTRRDQDEQDGIQYGRLREGKHCEMLHQTWTVLPIIFTQWRLKMLPGLA